MLFSQALLLSERSMVFLCSPWRSTDTTRPPLSFLCSEQTKGFQLLFMSLALLTLHHICSLFFECSHSSRPFLYCDTQNKERMSALLSNMDVIPCWEGSCGTPVKRNLVDKCTNKENSTLQKGIAWEQECIRFTSIRHYVAGAGLRHCKASPWPTYRVVPTASTSPVPQVCLWSQCSQQALGNSMAVCWVSLARRIF